MLTADAAEKLWQDLSGRYNLEWAPIQVGQVKLEILQIRDLEDYLVSNIETQGLSLENFPYWAMVWDAALVLADFLVKQDTPGNKNNTGDWCRLGLRRSVRRGPGAPGHPDR